MAGPQRSRAGRRLVLFATLSLSWRWAGRGGRARAIGALVMAAPFLFWTTNAAAYLSDTLVGALIFGFAICTRPEVGPSPLAANGRARTAARLELQSVLVDAAAADHRAGARSGCRCRAISPPINSAMSRACGSRSSSGCGQDPRNGTEEIITSYVSEAWPVSDAAVGGYTYVLEILTGIVGSRARWRTMPWLVMLFGLMIAPLGHHLDLLHHHPADRDRHLEHAGADRRGGDADPDPLFARRAARDAAVHAPAGEGRAELAARLPVRRYR